MNIEASLEALTSAILKLADAFNASAAAIKEEQPPSAPDAPVTPKVEPSKAADPAPTLDIKALREQGMKVIKAGKGDKMKALLTTYNVDALSKLPADKYADVHLQLVALVG